MQNALLLYFNQNATSSSFFSPTHQQICKGLKIIIGYSSVVPPVRMYTLSEVLSYVELILSSLAISHKLEKWTCCVLFPALHILPRDATCSDSDHSDFYDRFKMKIDH